ncbi:putative sucrose-phosphate synthase 4 [Abeliophyllum distichum]|uniref:sucrose-phosphate synthase n=1 Tax=Abeliophyllum distichum TaxID=126358 RepID=A0ABD1RP49_9LAMI
MRFFTNPHKPMILALSRPDPKKNVTTLIKAFGECQPLRELANLTLILGNRGDIEEMSDSSSVVLMTVLKLIDNRLLWWICLFKGVFINPALVEPFGLTLIEAAAYGLPIVATKHGGPVDILKKATSDALLKLVADKNLWHECQKNGLKNIQHFSWPEHCRNYLSYVEQCKNYHPNNRLSVMPIPEEPLSESLRGVEDLSLKFSIDIDVNVGELDAPNKQELPEILIQKATSNGKSTNIYCPGRRQ